jgi:hypothetical protein
MTVAATNIPLSPFFIIHPHILTQDTHTHTTLPSFSTLTLQLGPLGTHPPRALRFVQRRQRSVLCPWSLVSKVLKDTAPVTERHKRHRESEPPQPNSVGLHRTRARQPITRKQGSLRRHSALQRHLWSYSSAP